MKALFLVIAFFYTSICFASNDIFSIESPSFSYQQLKENRKQFLDEDFQPGKIILKEGSINIDNLNYHLYHNRICYYNEQNKPIILDDLSNVLLISYGNRTFVPISTTKVAEVIQILPDNSKLLYEREAELMDNSEGIGAYGSSTITSSTTKLSSFISTENSSSANSFPLVSFPSSPLKFDIPQDVKYEVKENFIISRGRKKFKISSLNR